jgi:hypothetical protein
MLPGANDFGILSGCRCSSRVRQLSSDKFQSAAPKVGGNRGDGGSQRVSRVAQSFPGKEMHAGGEKEEKREKSFFAYLMKIHRDVLFLEKRKLIDGYG